MRRYSAAWLLCGLSATWAGEGAPARPAARPGDVDGEPKWSETVNGLQCRLLVHRNRPTEHWKSVNGVMMPARALRDHPLLKLRNASNHPIYVPLLHGELPIPEISIKDFPGLRSPASYGDALPRPRLLKPGDVIGRQSSGNAFGNYLIGFGHWKPGTGWVPFDQAGNTVVGVRSSLSTCPGR